VSIEVDCLLCAVSMYPAELFPGSSLGLGYQLGAAAAAAAAASSPWRQLYMPTSPASSEPRYRHSPLQSTITPQHFQHHHHQQQQQQQQPVWSPTSAFTHPSAAAAGFPEGAIIVSIFCTSTIHGGPEKMQKV